MRTQPNDRSSTDTTSLITTPLVLKDFEPETREIANAADAKKNNPAKASWRSDPPERVRASASDVDLTIYRPSTLLWLSLFAFLTVPLLTLFDVPIARWFNNAEMPSELYSALDLTLVFSHGIGVFLILLGIILLAPRRRWQVPRMAALAPGGGSIAMLAKLFVLRPKPYALNLDLATTDSAWLWAFDWDLAQIATFDAQTRAFPSGKVATATALIVGLWVMLPRGRWLFACIGLGQLLHPLCYETHFLSDVAGGVGCGLLWGYVCFSPRLLGNLFDKLGPELPRNNRRNRQRGSAMPGLSDAASEKSKQAA